MSKCEQNDPHSQLWRTTRNHQNVRGVSNLCLSNKEARREDQENTAPVASLSEIKRDIADGKNIKRDFLRKVALVVARLPYPVERAMG